MASPAPLAFQYAAKFICGNVGAPDILTIGSYNTVVNVHNPNNQDLEYRCKLARAKDYTADGPISVFKNLKIGPDGAQLLNCAFVRALADVPAGDVIDGFLVVECAKSLDVVAVYTTNTTDQKGVPAIAVERVFERKTG